MLTSDACKPGRKCESDNFRASRSHLNLQRIGRIPPEPTPLTLGFVELIVKRENVYILVIFVCKIFMTVVISEKQLHKRSATTILVTTQSIIFDRMRGPHSETDTKTQPLVAGPRVWNALDGFQRSSSTAPLNASRV